MQRWGYTGAGTKRWRCAACATTGIRRRPDHRLRARQTLFNHWLTGNATRADIAAQQGVSMRTLYAWFALAVYPPTRVVVRRPATIVIFDATRIAPDTVLLIALDPKTNQPIGWAKATRESYASWSILLAHLPHMPRYAVSDGHNGLLKALRERWPRIQIQRCMAHVIRDALARLTRHPKLPAGQVLRQIVCQLAHIRTRRQKRTWIRQFHRWQQRHCLFLKEKTRLVGGGWHYTHRSLRRVASHIANALPDLFRYIGHIEVPRTSNKLEGGINGPLKDLMRKHRGLNGNMKVILASIYLHKRIKKPTRNFH